MPTLEQVTEFVYENLEGVTINRKGTNFHTRCPFCGDSKKSQSKKRFHLKYENDQAIYGNCFNCNNSCNFYSLYAHIIGVTSDEAYKKFNTYNKKSILKRLNGTKINTKNEDINNKYVDFSYILQDCITVDQPTNSFILKKYQHLLQQFIQERKIKQKLYIAYRGPFKSRIIIPIWYDNKMVYFQGRRIFSEMSPKYLNPSVNKNNIILNIENFNKDNHIIVVEGLLDAYTIGNQGTAVLGKEASKEFLSQLREKSNKPVIIAMDNDKDGMAKTIEYINNREYRNELFFIMPKKYNYIKDINELIININTPDVYNFVVENSYKYYKALTMLKLRS